jgi:acyl-CoA synthetase (AMP-forming)/AMP-acid ligase II/alkylation response protein AidB-like acyl-CoA dehydrogenase/acyl carrier protein
MQTAAERGWLNGKRKVSECVRRSSTIASRKFPSLYSPKLPSETLRHNPLTITEVLAQRAKAQPDAIAYTFLRDGEELGETLTFGQLYQRSLALGERLSTLSPPGSRAILLDPIGLDFFVAFFGSIYAGFIPVPVSLPNRQRGMHSLRGVAIDSGATCILSSTPLLRKYNRFLDSDLSVGSLARVAVDDLPLGPSPSWKPVPAQPSQVALLQYASGTTRMPRGVMVTHTNLLHNQQQIEHSFGHDARTVVVSWLPLFHDMGLGTALQGPWLGVHCVLMSPSSFVQKPVSWLRAVSRFRASFSGGPDFAFELCARRIDAAECAGLDLSCWTGAYNGSEPVRASTVERFVSRFAPFGFPRAGLRPVYGLAEATLLVSAEGPGEPPIIKHFSAPDLQRGVGKQSIHSPNRAMVSCGRPWLGTRVVVVDPETLEICRPGRVGEIWVGGQGVCAGYWQRPEETAASFHARTASGDGPFLRTADLGFLDGGGLYVTGRLKDLIVIRGENHYPQDIEATVSECHPSLEPMRCAAFVVEGEAGPELVIVQEVKRSELRRLDPEDIFRAIRGAVSHRHSLHTAAIVLIRPATLPRTSSGKVQRSLTSRAYHDKSLEQVASWTPSASPSSTRYSSAEADASRAIAADRLIAWLRKHLPERVGWNRDRPSFSEPLLRELGKQGLLGMQIDPQYGGLGLGHVDVVRVLEQLAAIDLSLCLFVALNNSLGMQPIACHAPAELKAQLLPRLVAGAECAGFAFLEPGGGNTPSSFSTLARADIAGRWRLFGSKCLQGQSHRASVINVFVRHEESPAVSAFVLADGASGLHIADDGFRVNLMGGLSHDTVMLDGVLVSSDQLLGNIGAGMELARQAMLQTRLFVGAACLGAMKRCAQLARRYSPYSGRIKGKLTPNPVMLSRFGSLAARVTTLETFIVRLARAMDAGQTVPAEAFALCKVAGPELLLRAVDDLMQLGAQRGADEMQRLSVMYSEASFLRTLDGPPESVTELVGALLADTDAKSLRSLVSTIFGAPEVLPAFDRIVNTVRQRLARSGGGLTRRAQRWSHTRAGELATWAVLVAAVEGARKEAPVPELARAASWIQAQFEYALSNVEHSTPAELAALDAADVAEAFAAYAQTIGDLEDDGAHEGADTPLPMGYWEPLSGIHSVARAPRSSTTGHVPSREELMEFVTSWLSQRVRLPLSKIDSSRSFAEHGLDSMAAVELTKALSDQLGRRLDETLLWNCATIDDVIQIIDAETAEYERVRTRSVLGAAAQPPLELDVEIEGLDSKLDRP